MSQPSQPDTHPTHILVATGEFLQTVLQPSTFMVMLKAPMRSREPEPPEEIAADLWCSPETVADDLHMLTHQTISLVRKADTEKGYTKTGIGSSIVGKINQMTAHLGTDLTEVNFTNENTKTTLTTVLTPLSNPESHLSWFVLNALRELSNTHHLHGHPQPVAYADLVADIEHRQQDRDESLDTTQLQQTLTHLEETDVLLSDGDECTLTDKGQEHVMKFHTVARMIETRRRILTALLAWRGDELITDDLCEMLDIQFSECSPHTKDLAARGVIDRIDPPEEATKYPADRIRYRLNMDHSTIAQLDQRIGEIAAGREH